MSATGVGVSSSGFRVSSFGVPRGDEAPPSRGRNTAKPLNSQPGTRNPELGTLVPVKTLCQVPGNGGIPLLVAQRLDHVAINRPCLLP